VADTPCITEPDVEGVTAWAPFDPVFDPEETPTPDVEGLAPKLTVPDPEETPTPDAEGLAPKLTVPDPEGAAPEGATLPPETALEGATLPPAEAAALEAPTLAPEGTKVPDPEFEAGTELAATDAPKEMLGSRLFVMDRDMEPELLTVMEFELLIETEFELLTVMEFELLIEMECELLIEILTEILGSQTKRRTRENALSPINAPRPWE